MFAFCFFDIKKKKLLLARDRFGIKPVFYHSDGKNLTIASEKKALIKLGVKKEINLDCLQNYLFNGVYQNDKFTFYKGIHSFHTITHARFFISKTQIQYNLFLVLFYPNHI